jgi:hypothetical protein
VPNYSPKSSGGLYKQGKVVITLMEDPGLLAGLFLLVLFSVLGVVAIKATSGRQEAGPLVKLFLLAIGLRFAASLAIYQFGLVEIIKDEDASGWEIGKAFSERWAQEGVGYLDLPGVYAKAYQDLHKGYYYTLGVVFYLTNVSSRLAAAAFNCFTGALTVIIAYHTAKALFSERIATRVGWWTCLFPSLILWSAQTLKEPVVILLESLAVYGCVALQRREFSFRHSFLILASIVLLIPFRFYAAYLVSATIILSFILGRMGSGRQLSAGRLFGSLAIAASVLLLSTSLMGQERDRELRAQYSLEGIERFRNNAAIGQGSGVKLDYDLHTPGGLAASLAVGSLHLLLAPFPWQLASGSLRMLVVAPEVLLWWWLFFTGILPGFKYALRWRFRDVLPLLFLIIGFGLLYSLMFSNVGLVYRQRAQLLPWLLIFAVVGREYRAMPQRLIQRKGQAGLRQPAPYSQRRLPLERVPTGQSVPPTAAARTKKSEIETNGEGQRHEKKY